MSFKVNYISVFDLLVKITFDYEVTKEQFRYSAFVEEGFLGYGFSHYQSSR